MKNNEIKKVFDKVKVDESMKYRILENVYKDLYTKKESKENKFNIIYLKHKKSLATLAASIVFIFGVFLYNENKLDNTKNIAKLSEPLNQSTPKSRMIIKNDEFNIDLLKDNTEKIEIINDKNGKYFKEITSEKAIKNILKLLQVDIEQNLKTENYNNFKDTGKVITLNFMTKDNLINSLKINTDLNVACINEKYYDLSSKIIKIINEE